MSIAIFLFQLFLALLVVGGLAIIFFRLLPSLALDRGLDDLSIVTAGWSTLATICGSYLASSGAISLRNTLAVLERDGETTVFDFIGYPLMIVAAATALAIVVVLAASLVGYVLVTTGFRTRSADDRLDLVALCAAAIVIGSTLWVYPEFARLIERLVPYPDLPSIY